MRENEKTLLYSYILSQRNQLDNELRQLQSNIRYREIDVVDCIELACTIERRNAFYIFSSHVLQLLRLPETEELGSTEHTMKEI